LEFEVIENQVINKAFKTIKKYNPKNNINYDELGKIIFEYKDEAFPELKEKNRVELSHELIFSTIMTKLRQKTFKKLGKLIANITVNTFHKFFRLTLWKKCCEMMQQHERNAGITQSAKKRGADSTKDSSLDKQTDTSRKQKIVEKLQLSLNRCKEYLTDWIGKGYSSP
jgi:hypothetical protein